LQDGFAHAFYGEQAGGLDFGERYGCSFVMVGEWEGSLKRAKRVSGCLKNCLGSLKTQQ